MQTAVAVRGNPSNVENPASPTQAAGALCSQKRKWHVPTMATVSRHRQTQGKCLGRAWELALGPTCKRGRRESFLWLGLWFPVLKQMAVRGNCSAATAPQLPPPCEPQRWKAPVAFPDQKGLSSMVCACGRFSTPRECSSGSHPKASGGRRAEPRSRCLTWLGGD